MEPNLLPVTALCALVGLSLGLLGGGGSVLMVPVFVYAGGMPATEAIAMSLLVVGLSSAAGAVKYFKQGFVNPRLAALFILPGIPSSYAGARFSGLLSEEQLLSLFGVLMMLISILLYRRASSAVSSDAPVHCRPALGVSLAAGSAVGFLTGLLGVGGGFLIVPAIALLMRCSLYTAVGTSLAVIAVNSAAGFAGHFSMIRTEVPSGILFVAATMGGAVAGTRILGRFSPVLLQRLFAALIFLTGAFVIIRHLRPEYGGSL